VWYNPNPKEPDVFETGEVRMEEGDDIYVVGPDGKVCITLAQRHTPPSFPQQKKALSPSLFF